MTQRRTVTISVVSHRQADLLVSLLADVNRHCASMVEVIITLNVPEELPFRIEDYEFPLRIIRNSDRKGFGANHNAAFRQSAGGYFCIVNPDIRFNENPFPALIDCLRNIRVAVAAPLVVNPDGGIEDSARRFPTPSRILAKVLKKRQLPDYIVNEADLAPDWVGGMFMLIPVELFRRVNGFNEHYFLYYEDVDLCARLHLMNYEIRLCPKSRVIHAARRQSHHDWRYLRWHLASMARFFMSAVFFRLFWVRLKEWWAPSAAR